MRIAFTALAAREADEAANWYRARAGIRIQGRLLAEIERAREVLLNQPGIGTPGAGGTRTLPLAKFPYTLVYRIDGDRVRVLAFMHQSRRPDYWQHRR